MASVTLRYGGKLGTKVGFSTSAEFLVVRTRNRMPLTRAGLSGESRRALESATLHAAFSEPGVEILQLDSDAASHASLKKTLARDPKIQFAGRVLLPAAREKTAKTPVVYTENLFVQLARGVKAPELRRLLRKHRLELKRRLPWLPGGYFVAAPEGSGLSTFEIANELLQRSEIALCHPEVVRVRGRRKAFPQQWHLKTARVAGKSVVAHAHVTAAWRYATGKGTTIAIIDDGVDIDHLELALDGKIVAPRDVTQGDDDPRPGRDSDHGTACAGVACAAGRSGASGVAPDARLMPIRLASPLGSMNEAEAFVWAAEHGADVISCSWGPEDGAWWDPSDPIHRQKTPLPDSTRLAIDHAASKGRGGKGCVICFAAGNGNESVDNDGYASYEKVIAVAACNDTSKRSVYSDFGDAVWCAFPSSDFEDPATNHPKPRTPGIWTTDRSGHAGYNPGGSSERGDLAGDYTGEFGGTSSAAPGVAGVVALILSRNPALTREQVRDVLKRTADRIDLRHGRYDANRHSPLYGYGRVNALRAVKAAKT